MKHEAVHISSLVVLCRPQTITQTALEIEQNQQAEIYVQDDSGKIIVVLETPSEHNILDNINQIERISDVISATLVYHQID